MRSRPCGLEGAVDRGEEVVAVKRNVEADEIGAQEAVEQLGLPGTIPMLRLAREYARRLRHAHRPLLLDERGSKARW